MVKTTCWSSKPATECGGLWRDFKRGHHGCRCQTRCCSKRFTNSSSGILTTWQTSPGSTMLGVRGQNRPIDDGRWERDQKWNRRIQAGFAEYSSFCEHTQPWGSESNTSHFIRCTLLVLGRWPCDRKHLFNISPPILNHNLIGSGTIWRQLFQAKPEGNLSVAFACRRNVAESA